MSIYLAVFAGLLKQKQAVIFDMARHKEVLTQIQRGITSATVHTSIESYSAHVILNRFPTFDIPVTGWSMRFSNLQAVLAHLDANQPETIIEFGSGASTLLIASWLRERGKGRLVSIDHDPKWGEHTRQILARHGLEQHVQLIVAPLTARGDTQGLWYDIDVRDHFSNLSFDLVVVDGPPGHLTPDGTTRMPAIPQLEGLLSDTASVILDDTNRPGEKQILREWKSQLCDSDPYFVHSPSGAVIIRRRSGLPA